MVVRNHCADFTDFSKMGKAPRLLLHTLDEAESTGKPAKNHSFSGHFGIPWLFV